MESTIKSRICDTKKKKKTHIEERQLFCQEGDFDEIGMNQDRSVRFFFHQNKEILPSALFSMPQLKVVKNVFLFS